MQFKQWIIAEMSHLVVPRSNFSIEGKKIKSIDMHFEKYPQKYLRYVPDWFYHFFAKFPGQNIYLICKNGKTTITPKNTMLSLSLFGEKHELPEFWWNYAQILFSDGTIKPSQDKQ